MPHAAPLSTDLTAPPAGQGRLLAVNVGLPRNVDWNGRTVYTGIWKSRVDGPVMARRLNLDGDGQGDQAGHGGEQRAVMVYQLESYRHWQQHFDRTDFEWGHFGENFTIAGLPDSEVCIGDRYRIGAAEFEVTQPRVTCFRVGLRLGAPDLPNLLVAHHRPGFYFRVITEGQVQAGDRIELIGRARHSLSVSVVDALLYLPDPDTEQLRQATHLPALSPGWQRSFRDMVADRDSGRGRTSPPVGIEPGWSGFRPLTVTAIVPESATVISIHLADSESRRLPVPRPGQFLTIRLPADGGPPPVRNYSLSGGVDGTSYRISVKKQAGGRISAWLHDHLSVGATIDSAAPRGDFYLDEDAADPVVLVSAGIGITPVLAMLHRLVAQSSTREVWWLHTTRNAEQHAFAGEVDDLIRQLPQGHAESFYTAAESTRATVSAGRLSPEAVAALGIPAMSSVYICGPDAFMASMRDAFCDLGIAPAQIHSERFGALAPVNPGIVGATAKTPHRPDGSSGPGPSVTFARSGLTVPWDPQRFRSLLELAEACDVPTRWQCRSGVCHTCVTPVLSGTADYTPRPLLEPPADEVLVCCSRPTTEMVLDL